MRHLKSGLILAGVAALSLAACSKKAEETIKTETTVADAAATAPAVAAGPKRKAGLWEQTTTGEGMATMTSKVCVSESLELCPGSTVAATPEGYSVTATCDRGTGGVMKIEGTGSGDLNSAYELNATATTTGAAVPQMNMTLRTKTTMKYLGACPEGMKVGDQEMANGTTINMSGYDPAKAKAIAEAAKAGQ